MKQRADECIRALDLLVDINAGKAVQNVLLSEFDWSTLKVILRGLICQNVVKVVLAAGKGVCAYSTLQYFVCFFTELYGFV